MSLVPQAGQSLEGGDQGEAPVPGQMEIDGNCMRHHDNSCLFLIFLFCLPFL